MFQSDGAAQKNDRLSSIDEIGASQAVLSARIKTMIVGKMLEFCNNDGTRYCKQCLAGRGNFAVTPKSHSPCT